jgi:hypothetical protein
MLANKVKVQTINKREKAGAENAVIMHYSLHVAELHVLSNISGRRLEVILGSPDTS